MMARGGSKSASNKARTEQERARLHRARAEWHQSRIQRRTKDNVIAGVAGGLLILLTITSQSVHAIVLDNTPAPTPSTTITPFPSQSVTPSPEPSDSAEPEETPEPSPEPSETGDS